MKTLLFVLCAVASFAQPKPLLYDDFSAIDHFWLLNDHQSEPRARCGARDIEENSKLNGRVEFKITKK
jgi:hypothetical protein